MTGETRDCPSCGLQREFSQLHPGPERCPDGPECPEWFCASCGTALLLPVGPSVVTALAPSAARQLNRVA